MKTARTAFYPAVDLTGSGGFQAPALNALISPGVHRQPGGRPDRAYFRRRRTARRAGAGEGRQAELLADYRKAVVQAFTDVDNALVAWRYTSDQEKLQIVSVDVARRAATIAREQMIAGTADVTAVLTAETAVFTAEDTLAKVRLARVQALLSLYKALGGGWRKVAADKFPGLSPGMSEGGIALPIDAIDEDAVLDRGRLTGSKYGRVDTGAGDGASPPPREAVDGEAAVRPGHHRHRRRHLVLAGAIAGAESGEAARPQSGGPGRGGGGHEARHADLPGRTGHGAGVQTVTMKPMVDGPLVDVEFKEGQDVRKGDVLARIDPRTFQAALDKAVAKRRRTRRRWPTRGST